MTEKYNITVQDKEQDTQYPSTIELTDKPRTGEKIQLTEDTTATVCMVIHNDTKGITELIVDVNQQNSNFQNPFSEVEPETAYKGWRGLR